MLDTASLLKPQGPFFTFLEDEAALGEALAALAARPEATVGVVAGAEAATDAAAMTAIARALAFPDYFGRNWDALDECLTDLEWLPTRHVVLVFRDAGRVLAGKPDDMEILVEILATTAEAWAEAAEPAIPMSFHVLLQDRPEALEPWVQACMEQGIVIRR